MWTTTMKKRYFLRPILLILLYCLFNRNFFVWFVMMTTLLEKRIRLYSAMAAVTSPFINVILELLYSFHSSSLLECYDIESIPAGDWYCQLCEDKLTAKTAEIVCCQEISQTHAYKRVTTPNDMSESSIVYHPFIHVLCGLWNPTLFKYVNETKEFQFQSSAMKEREKGKECVSCQSSYGYTVKCNYSACKR